MCELGKVVQSKWWSKMMVVVKVMATKEMIKCSNLEKKREKNKKPRRSRQRYQMGFYFGTQDTIEGVSVFRIDSGTIKRENLWLIGYRVPLGDMIIAYALGT
jgi:hypothetical protein